MAWDTLDFALFARTALVKQLPRVGVARADNVGVAVPGVEGVDDAAAVGTLELGGRIILLIFIFLRSFSGLTKSE